MAMRADTGILETFVDDLDHLLNHGTYGVNANMEGGWKEINKIDSSFDTTQLEAKYAPQLLAFHVNAQLEEATSHKRDWVHTVAFLYKDNQKDAEARRKSAARVAEAVLASINPFPGEINDRFDNAKVIDIRNLEAFVGWERDTGHKDEYLLATAEFVHRQEIP